MVEPICRRWSIQSRDRADHAHGDLPSVPARARLVSERRHHPAADEQLAVFDPGLVVEEPARRRAGGPLAIRVVRAAVAGTHEEPRLREPANRTPEVRAIDREDLKFLSLQAPHPARDVTGGAVPGPGERIAERREPRLAFGECVDVPQRNPRERFDHLLLARGRREKADERDAEQDAGQRVQGDAQFQEAAARHRARRLMCFVILLLHRSLLNRPPVGSCVPPTLPPDRVGPDTVAASRRARRRRRTRPGSRAIGLRRSRASRAGRDPGARQSPWCEGSGRSPGRGTIRRRSSSPFGPPLPSGPWHEAQNVR